MKNFAQFITEAQTNAAKQASKLADSLEKSNIFIRKLNSCTSDSPVIKSTEPM